MVGDRSRAMWSRTAIFLADLTGMEINVPSGLKNWSICSDMCVIIKAVMRVIRNFTKNSIQPWAAGLDCLHDSPTIRREHGTCS